MIAFSKNVRESLMQFNSDMAQMFADLKKVITDKPDMCEEELTTDMMGIFTYLFGASEQDNIRRKYRIAGSRLIADIAISTSELSFKKKEADVIIEMKRCEVTLNMKNFKQLVEYMLRARAAWGILSNGYYTYFYRLEDIQDKLECMFTNDFSLSEYAFLVINIYDYSSEDLEKLKEFSEECFRSDGYIESVKSAELINNHSGVYKILSSSFTKENLFYFDEKMCSIEASSAAYCLLDTENYDLIKEIILTDDQYMYSGIDILSIPLFMELTAEERAEYMSFAKKMKEVFDLVLKCIQSKADADFIQQTFINGFTKAMGYKEFSSLSARDIDSSYSEYVNLSNTVADPRSDCIRSLHKRNYVTPLVYSTSTCPLVIITHDISCTNWMVGENYIKAGKSLVIESNGNMFTLWMKVQGEPISYTFLLKNMSFSIMYDLFLLSKEKFSNKIIDDVDSLERAEVYKWNRKINERYKNRIRSILDVNKHMEIVTGNDLPQELTLNTDIKTLMLQEIGFNDEICAYFKSFDERLDRCEDAVQKILKVINESPVYSSKS